MSQELNKNVNLKNLILFLWEKFKERRVSDKPLIAFFTALIIGMIVTGALFLTILGDFSNPTTFTTLFGYLPLIMGLVGAVSMLGIMIYHSYTETPVIDKSYSLQLASKNVSATESLISSNLTEPQFGTIRKLLTSTRSAGNTEKASPTKPSKTSEPVTLANTSPERSSTPAARSSPHNTHRFFNHLSQQSITLSSNSASEEPAVDEVADLDSNNEKDDGNDIQRIYKRADDLWGNDEITNDEITNNFGF